MPPQVCELRSQVTERLRNGRSLNLSGRLAAGVRAKRRWNEHFNSHGWSLRSHLGSRSGLGMNLDSFLRIFFAIVVEPPGGHFLGNSLLHVHDNVTEPRPGVVPVVLAGRSRMIRVRVIPTDQIHPLNLSGSVGFNHIERRYRKTVFGGIVAPVYKAQTMQDLTRSDSI